MAEVVKVVQLEDPVTKAPVAPVTTVDALYSKNGTKVDNLLSYSIVGTGATIPESTNIIETVNTHVADTTKHVPAGGTVGQHLAVGEGGTRTWVDNTTIDIIDNLASTRTDAALSAKQGKELFQSVSSGKALVASAITDKGVTTAADATFQQISTNIGAIVTNPYSSVVDTFLTTYFTSCSAMYTDYSNITVAPTFTASSTTGYSGTWNLDKDDNGNMAKLGWYNSGYDASSGFGITVGLVYNMVTDTFGLSFSDGVINSSTAAYTLLGVTRRTGAIDFMIRFTSLGGTYGLVFGDNSSTTIDVTFTYTASTIMVSPVPSKAYYDIKITI